MRIALLGFGLIGGSIARALRERGAGRRTPTTSAAWTPSGDGPAAAARDGVIDVAACEPGGRDRRAPISSSSPAPRRSAWPSSMTSPAPWRSALAPGCRHHRRRQHEGRHRAAGDRARSAVRRRPSDGRARDQRLRRIDRGPVRRPAVGRRPERRRCGRRAGRGPRDGHRRATAADDRGRPRRGGRRDLAPAARRRRRAGRGGRRWQLGRPRGLGDRDRGWRPAAGGT